MNIISDYRKAWVSVIMAILLILDQVFGIRIGLLTEEYVTLVIAVLWPLIVLVTPNGS